MSWFGLVIVCFLISRHAQSWSIIHPVRKSNDKSENSVLSHGEMKEDWETKGKILYANEIIQTTTVSPDAIATTIDEISEDENEVNCTAFTLFSLNTTERSLSSTCGDAEQLTTEISVQTEVGPDIPDKETNQGTTLTKTRISYRPVGFIAKNNSSKKYKCKHGFLSKTLSKTVQNQHQKSSNDQHDKSKVSVTTIRSIKREIRSVHPTDKTEDCKGLHSYAMKQLYSALMSDNFDPNKKKRENERNSDKSISDFMSEGFWETPMTRIMGTGVDDVKVQFARPLVNNLNSLNESDPVHSMDNNEPLEIISNEDHGKNVQFFENTKNLQDFNDKYGYYKSSSKKKSGDFDLEQLMNWPSRWEEQSKKVYSSEQSKKTLQKWGKLAGKLQPIWDAVDEKQVEVTTEFKGGQGNALITYESKTLPLNYPENYKSQQSSNLETPDPIKKTNEMKDLDVEHLQSIEKSSAWKEQSRPTNKDLLREVPTLGVQKTLPKTEQNTKVESFNTVIEGDRSSTNNYNDRRPPPSNSFVRNYKTDELITPPSKGALSNWESSAGRNHMIEFSNLPKPSVELQQLLNARNQLAQCKANKIQDYRQESKLSTDESRSKWELPQSQRSQQKWGRGDMQKPTIREHTSKWERADFNKPDFFQTNGEVDDEQNKFMKEQQSIWENIEIGNAHDKLMKEHQSKSENSEVQDAYNNFLKQHQSKWENIEVEDAPNKLTKGHQSNGIWALPNIVDLSTRESRLKSEPYDVKNSQENALQWKIDNNPTSGEYKQYWGFPTADDQLFAEPNPSIWQTPKFQNPSESIHPHNQVPLGELSPKWTQLQTPSGEFSSKWQEPEYHNPSAVFSNTNWDQINVPGFAGHQLKWSNLQSLNNKDSDVQIPMLNERSVRPNFKFPMGQNYSFTESQQNLRHSMVVPNMKWDNVNLLTCSLTDDSLPIKESNVNCQNFKEVTGNQESLIKKSKETLVPAGNILNGVHPDSAINDRRYLDQNSGIFNPIKNAVNSSQIAFKDVNRTLPISNGQKIVEQSNLQISSVKDPTKFEISQLVDQKINIGKFNEPTNVSSTWTQDPLNDRYSIKTQKLDGESFDQSISLFHKLNHGQKDTLNPQILSGNEFLNPKFINSSNAILAESQLDFKNEQIIDQSSDELKTFQHTLANGIGTNGRIITESEPLDLMDGQSQPKVTMLQNELVDEAYPLKINDSWLQGNPMNMIHYNGLTQAIRPLKKSNASNQITDDNYRNSIYKEVNKENSQIKDSQSKWNSDNNQNPSLRDIQRQWDTVNYVSNPITAESQLHWEHNSIEGELEPQQNVPNLQTLEQESVNNVKMPDIQKLNDNRSQDSAKETQNFLSNTVKSSKLHARTTNIKNIKTSSVNLEKKDIGVSETSLDSSNIKNTEVKSEASKSAETDLTPITLDSSLKNSSDNEIADNLKIKSGNVIEGKVQIRGNSKIQNSLDDEKTNNPDVVNFVENPNECEQKDKVTKSIRSSERQYLEKCKNRKSQLNAGINVDVDDIIVCDSPLTYDKDSEDEQYFNVLKNKDVKGKRNKSKVIESKARSYSDIPWQKNWKISKQNLRNRKVSKAKKRKMVPPINITIAMKNLFNRVSPSEVSVRNSSTLDPDGSFKFSIELKDKMAKFFKRSIEHLIAKNETTVRNLKNK